jgi:transcriptional regulator with XRE-family HTH domain
MVRRARQAAGLTQDALAAKLAKLTGESGLTNKRLSALETGFRPPTETEQIAIVEALGIDLAQLLAACERDAVRREEEAKKARARENTQRRRAERAAAAGREIVPRASKYRPREAAIVVAPPAARVSKRAPVAPSGAGDTLEDLIDALIAIVPMPSDREERQNWFRCARELFALSR